MVKCRLEVRGNTVYDITIRALHAKRNKQATDSGTTKGDRKEPAPEKKWIEIKFQVTSSDLDGLESRLVKLGEQSPDPLVLEQLLPGPQRSSSGIAARLGRCQCSSDGRRGQQEHQQEEQGNKVEATARSHVPLLLPQLLVCF